MSTNLYEANEKYIVGSWPRSTGSVKPETPEKEFKVCYRKYTNRGSPKSHQTPVNLVFLHGTGMNKGIWHYHIARLFSDLQNSPLFIRTAVAIDAANHAGSAKVNKPFLGDYYDWSDGSRDAVKITEHEFGKNGNNIIIGHSMGGAQAMYATYLEPELFTRSIVLNPVSYNRNMTDAIRRKLVEPGLMETSFDIPPSTRAADVVYDYFQHRSLFLPFNPEVLKHMISDDMPENPNRHVELHTSQHQTLVTYASADGCLPFMKEAWSKLSVHTVRLLSEKDVAPSQDRSALGAAGGKTMQTVALPGAKHNVHAEDPVGFTDVLAKVLRGNVPSKL